MSTSGKEPVRGHPQTDEESSRSYFSLSKHLLRPMSAGPWLRPGALTTAGACRFP